MLLDKENPAVFYGNQINKHYEEVRRSTFLATSRYDRVRRLAAVRYYLTRLFLIVRMLLHSG